MGQCYPVLYISWNSRCRAPQKKSSSRGKVSLQRSRSGKTIRWNGREETRSKLFPLFFFFSLHHFSEGLLGGGGSSIGKEAMTRGLRIHSCTAHASGATESRGHIWGVCRVCHPAVGLLGCFFTAQQTLEQKCPTANRIHESNPPNRSYQEHQWLYWWCVSIMNYAHWLHNSLRWKVAKRC